MKEISAKYCIIGAGPAGLGAAWEFMKHGENDVVVIDRNRRVGGLARTEQFDGNRFDVGPHRFFTKNDEVNALWHEVLGSDFRPVVRFTRIFYKGKLFRYPLSAKDALPKMGFVEAAHALVSYLVAQLMQNAEKAQTFEEWVSAKFGTKLYRTFFKTYTEKVWGIPCSQVGAEWASQRIKGLDLFTVLKDALGLRREHVKTLVDEFDYPTKGAGMMYERMAEILAEKGQRFLTETRVEHIERQGDRITGAYASHPTEGPILIKAEHYITSIPLTHFVKMLRPSLDEHVVEAANLLYYRDHITVNLLVEGENLFPDQWIYVHAPDVKMARLTNYNNFSKAMVAEKGTSAISAEYFAFQHEDIWRMDDPALIALADDEGVRMGLIPKGAVRKGWVIRETESYPTYYLGYKKPYETIREAVSIFTNCTPVGRGGLYKYNNMDHSLYTGMLAARNLVDGEEPQRDVWQVNIDAEYLESGARVRPVREEL